MADLQTTRLNKPWYLKMAIFIAVLLGVGLWGLYDATIAYPAQGLRYASFQQFQYLEAAKSNAQLDNRLSIDDPAAELDRITKLDPAYYTPLDGPRLAWLKALRVAGRLDPSQTRIDDARKKYEELQKEWTTTSGGAPAAPKKLDWYDIPVQWLIAAVGILGAIALAALFLHVSRVKYRWDEPSATLHLPDGNTLTPADIEDFDKRKWDKFLIFLKIKPSHATLGGRELKLDLYRHAPLEEWVLHMERIAFPERAQDQEESEPDTKRERQSDDGSSSSSEGKDEHEGDEKSGHGDRGDGGSDGGGEADGGGNGGGGGGGDGGGNGGGD